MDYEQEEILIPPLVKARRLYYDYYPTDSELKVFRCDEFLINLVLNNNIQLDFYSFSTDKFCGLLTIDEDEATILVNNKSPAYRRNFTIAHELGHYFMHRHKKSNFPDRTTDLLNSTNEIFERQANVFASEIILPTPVVHVMLRSRYSFHRISVVTQTSYETLKWRLVRHLRHIYKLSLSESSRIVGNFETLSIYEDKKTEIHNLVINTEYQKIINS